MINENDVEYIVRAKNTEIEYKNKSYKKIILALICFIILALVLLSNQATIYDVEVQELVYRSIKLLIVGVVLFIAIYLLKTFLEIKIEKTEKIKMLKLIDNSIIIKTRLKVYVIKYRDLIEIKLRHVGDAETANYTIRIVIKYT